MRSMLESFVLLAVVALATAYLVEVGPSRSWTWNTFVVVVMSLVAALLLLLTATPAPGALLASAALLRLT
jgi:hypothetical protein